MTNSNMREHLRGADSEPEPPVHRAYFDLHYSLLAELLHLPEDAEIVAVTGPDELIPNRIARIYVDHPDLPETNLARGHLIPRVTPTYRTERRKVKGIQVYVDCVFFEGW